MANQNNNQQQKASPKNLNVITLEGRLAADATLKQAQEGSNGVSHCYFRLAVNEGYLRSDGTNAVSFIPCNISGKRADSIAQYLKQGMRVSVTGSLSVRSNKLADGQYSDSCMISVDQVFFGPQAQPKDQNQASAPAPQPQYQQQAPATPAPQPQYQQPVQDNPFAGAPAQGFDFNNNPFADGAMNPPMFQ